MTVGLVDWNPPFLTCLEPAGVGVACVGGATFLLCLEPAGVGVVCAGGATFVLFREQAGVVAVWFVGWISSCFLCLCLEPAGVVAVCLVALRGPFLLCLELAGVGLVHAGGASLLFFLGPVIPASKS